MALKELGFESYVGPVLESAEEFRKTMAVSLCVVVVAFVCLGRGWEAAAWGCGGI